MSSLQVAAVVSHGYLVLGVVLVVAAVINLFWTTLWVDGGSGPLSSRLTTGVW